MSNLADAVSDYLYKTQGYSEDITVEYIIHTATNAKNAASIESVLPGGSEQEKKDFASKLFSNVPKKHEQMKKEKKAKEREYAKKVASANKRYALIDGSDNDNNSNNQDRDITTKSKKKKKEKHRKDNSNDQKSKNKLEKEGSKSRKHKKRKYSNGYDSSNDDSNEKGSIKKHESSKSRKSTKSKEGSEKKLKFQPSNNKRFGRNDNETNNQRDRPSPSNSGDDYDDDYEDGPPKKRRRVLSKEEEMELDQKEKMLFEERLHKNDLERQKLAKLSKEEKERLEEDGRRRALLKIENENEKVAFNIARDTSRRQYLEIRRAQQVAIYNQEIEDESRLFDESELTKSEIADRKRKQKAKKLLDEATKLRENDSTKHRYHIPSEYDITEDGLIDKEARKNILQSRYDDGETLENFRNISKNGNNNSNDNEYTSHSFEDQQAWESSKMSTAFTNRENKTEDEIWFEKSKKENYDLILEDQITFIKDEMTHGHDLEKELKEEILKREKAQRGKTRKEKHEDLIEFRKTLPIYKYRDEFIQALKDYQILIVVAETGSGKTTQIPQYIYENAATFLGINNKSGEIEGKIAITQPRRVAAMSVASRVSEEVGCRLGDTVGYSVRFEDKTNENTIIKYMTDGMLLREFLDLTNFNKYKVIIIDEAHERTLHTDILFGLVKDACRWKSNENLKLIISSATLQADKFSNFFDNAPKFIVPGRPYPVTCHYLTNPESDYLEACVITILKIHLQTNINSGDILVFLTGQEEIDIIKDALNEKMLHIPKKQLFELKILPIYANLPSDQQILVFEQAPKDTRKCILATNIAETSLTIDGISYVIDPGFAKQNNYDPRTGMDSLIVTPISQASAEQRKGRAGRTGPGNCYRLYTKYSYQNEMLEMTIPEIQRTNLGNVVLTLKSIGINNIIEFDYMDAPPAESLIQALECLYAMGAFNIKGELTKLGRKMAEFPINPEFSKMLCHSEKYHCVSEILTIVAMLSSNHIVWYRPNSNFHKNNKNNGNNNDNSNSNTNDISEPLSITADTMHRNFWKVNGDMFTLENVYSQWVDTNYSKEWTRHNFLQWRALNRARDIREQLENMLERVEIECVSVKDYVKENNLINYENFDKGMLDENDPNAIICKFSKDIEFIGKALCSGLFMRVAKFDASKGKYKCIKSKSNVMIHPSSSLAHLVNDNNNNQHNGNNSSNSNDGKRMSRNKNKNKDGMNPPKWVLFSELVLTTQEYMRNVIEIEPSWLYEVAPHFWKQSDASNELQNEKKRKGQAKIKSQNVKRGQHAPVV